MKDITIEDVINADILRIPECGECKFCLDTSTIRKLCVKRLAKRNQLLIAASTNSLLYSDDPDSKGSKSKKGKLSLKKNSIGFDPSNSISSKMMKSTNAVKKSTISSKKSPSSKSLLLKKATRPSIGEHNVSTKREHRNTVRIRTITYRENLYNLFVYLIIYLLNICLH